MNTSELSKPWRPIIALYLLSPIIAELLFGSTPASRWTQLIFESLLYGSGVLLIREIVVRKGLGLKSILLLGVAFGIIEECLVLQSAFNPHFLGNDISYGRYTGVNWLWAEYMIGYHALWSITIPVLISHVAFADHRDQPWFNKPGLLAFAGIFLFACIAFHLAFVKITGFQAELTQYLIATIAFLFLIAASLSPTLLTLIPLISYRIGSPFLSGLVAFTGCAIWLLLFSSIFKQGWGMPSWLLELPGVVVIILLFSSIDNLPNPSPDRRLHLGYISGCLAASMLFGLIMLIQAGNYTDVAFQIGFILIATALLFLQFRKRSRASLSQAL